MRAVPGAGLDVPIWILGSSLFGAQLAAALGLPFAFASHFAPAALTRRSSSIARGSGRRRSSSGPTSMLGVNVFAAETDDGGPAAVHLAAAGVREPAARPTRAAAAAGRGLRRAADAGRTGALLDEMLSYSVVGSPETVRRGLEAIVARTGADELMLASQIYDHAARLRSYELAAGVLV